MSILPRDDEKKTFLSVLGEAAIKAAALSGNPLLAAVGTGLSVISSMNKNNNKRSGAFQNSIKGLGLGKWNNPASGNIAKSAYTIPNFAGVQTDTTPEIYHAYKEGRLLV